MQSLHINSESNSGHIWLSSALGAQHGRNIVAVNSYGRFLYAAFRKEPLAKKTNTFDDVVNDISDSVSANQLVAIDHLGNVLKFDISRNKYRKLLNLGSPPTALCWQLAGKNGVSDCAIATADGHVRGIITNSRHPQKMTVAERGHDPLLPANWLSVNNAGNVLVSSSLDAAILWDTSDSAWHRIRRLVMRQQIDMAGALFVPMSDLLVTAFSDGSVLAWQPDSLSLAFRLPALPQSLVDDKSKSVSPSTSVARHFTASIDGRWLVAAEADCCRLAIWSLDAKTPRLRGPRTVNLATWLPNKSSTGIIQSITAFENATTVGGTKSPAFMAALVDHSILIGVDVEEGRPLFVTKEILPLDIADCHSVSLVAFMTNRSHMESAVRRIAVLSAHSGALFLVPEPDQLNRSTRHPQHSNTEQSASGKRSNKKPEHGPRMDAHRSLALSKHQETRNPLDECGIERSALVQLLRHYGAFPNRLRSLIWRLLLKLPRNHGAFASLLDRGAHPCVSGLSTRYPVRSAKLMRLLARVLSSLAHWSPIFGETEFLPMFVFPFLHVFEADAMACFELIATILIGFCQHWFEYAPHPPIAVLSAIENLLAHADQRLLLHLTAHQLTAQDYAWPLLQTAFSEILAGADWLRVWDHVFASGPAFFVAFPVAYLISARSALLRLSDRDEFMFFIRNRNAVDVDRVIAETNSLLATAPSDVHPATAARLVTDVENWVLPVGPAYPVFDRYPKYVINFRSEERERLRRDFTDPKLGDSMNSSRLFNNVEEDEDRRLRFVAMERHHNREDVSLSGALENEALKPIYRGAKLKTGLADALEQIEVALERLDSNEDEDRGRAHLKNAAQRLLDAVGDKPKDSSPLKRIGALGSDDKFNLSVSRKAKAARSPGRNVIEARDKLRACVSELRRDLHRRRLVAEQPL